MPPGLGRSYVTTLTHQSATERDVSAMIDRVVGHRPLPAALRQDIVERTDGIPLFVEEMTKAVLKRRAKALRTVPPPPFRRPPSGFLRACRPR